MAYSEARTSDVISSADCRQICDRGGTLGTPNQISPRERMPSMGWLARGKRSKYIEHHEEARAEATKDADWCSQARGRDRLRRRPTTQREGWGFPPAAADGRGWLIRMVRPEWSFRRPASKLFRTRAAAAAERAKLEAMIEQGKTQFAAWRQWLNGLSCRRAEIKQPPSGSRRLELTNRDGVCLPIPESHSATREAGVLGPAGFRMRTKIMSSGQSCR